MDDHAERINKIDFESVGTYMTLGGIDLIAEYVRQEVAKEKHDLCRELLKKEKEVTTKDTLATVLAIKSKHVWREMKSLSGSGQ